MKKISELGRVTNRLDCGTISNSLIRVDGLLKLLAVEEIAQELLDLWNTCGTTNQDDLVDLALVDVGILKNLGDWIQGAVEGL